MSEDAEKVIFLVFNPFLALENILCKCEIRDSA
jgi:hypothetical protein